MHLKTGSFSHADYGGRGEGGEGGLSTELSTQAVARMFRGQCKTACINDDNNNTQRQVIYRACLDQTTFYRHSSKHRATCSMSRATLTQTTLTPFFTQRLLSACVAFTDRNCLTFYPLTFLQACDSVIHVRPERTLIFVRCIFEHFGIVHTKRNNKKKKSWTRSDGAFLRCGLPARIVCY